MWHDGWYERREPRNQKEIRQILCIMGNYQAFIPTILKLAFWSFWEPPWLHSFHCILTVETDLVYRTLVFSVNVHDMSSNSGHRDHSDCDPSSLEPKIILFVNLRW